MRAEKDGNIQRKTRTILRNPTATRSTELSKQLYPCTVVGYVLDRFPRNLQYRLGDPCVYAERRACPFLGESFARNYVFQRERPGGQGGAGEAGGMRCLAVLARYVLARGVEGNGVFGAGVCGNVELGNGSVEVGAESKE